MHLGYARVSTGDQNPDLQLYFTPLQPVIPQRSEN